MDERQRQARMQELREFAVQYGVMAEHLPEWADLVPASKERERIRRRQQFAADFGVLWQFVDLPDETEDGAE